MFSICHFTDSAAQAAWLRSADAFYLFFGSAEQPDEAKLAHGRLKLPAAATEDSSNDSQLRFCATTDGYTDVSL